MAEVTPGTTSNGMRAFARARASSPPRPKTKGSPPLSRTTRLPSEASAIKSSLISSWRKAWRVLNLVGFGFTFVIGTLWGVTSYRPEFFASAEPFLVAFFLLYVAVPILYARRESFALRHYVDGTLVFGVPLVAFGLQTGLVRQFEYGAAWSAFALGAFYLMLASALWRRAGENLRLLTESFLALGVGFGTLAIPLAFDGRITSAAWALEGAAIVWVSARQARVDGVSMSQPAAERDDPHGHEPRADRVGQDGLQRRHRYVRSLVTGAPLNGS